MSIDIEKLKENPLLYIDLPDSEKTLDLLIKAIGMVDDTYGRANRVVERNDILKNVIQSTPFDNIGIEGIRRKPEMYLYLPDEVQTLELFKLVYSFRGWAVFEDTPTYTLEQLKDKDIQDWNYFKYYEEVFSRKRGWYNLTALGKAIWSYNTLIIDTDSLSEENERQPLREYLNPDYCLYAAQRIIMRLCLGEHGKDMLDKVYRVEFDTSGIYDYPIMHVYSEDVYDNYYMGARFDYRYQDEKFTELGA